MNPSRIPARTVTATQSEASEGHLSSSDTQRFSAPARWPNITELLANAGHITVGHIAPIEGVAVAANEYQLLVTLVRRSGEPVDGLLQRLDHAIGEALNRGVHTNEIEGGHFILAGPERIVPQ
jgi:hypothetical protein